MISYSTYKLIHLIGIFILFLAFGILIGSEKGKGRMASLLHGLGLLVIIVSGFGSLARLDIHGSLPPWVIGKLVIWLLMGASLSLAKRKLLPGPILVTFLLCLGGAAGYLALWKP